MIKIALVAAVIPVVLISLIRLGVRVLRFVRKHRDEVARGLALGGVQGFIAEALEDFATEPPSHGATSDHGYDGDAEAAPAHSVESASHSD